MIELNIGLDGVPNSKRLQIGNKYENNDEVIKFILPIEFENYKKYVIAVIKKNNEKVTKVFPITDNQFFVSTDITYISGSWSMYLMCRENEIDLEAEEVDISANNGEHVFISDGFIGVVSDSDIDKELVDNIPMDTNLHIVYEDLLKIKQELIDKINTHTSYNDLVDVPTKVSQFENDKKYQTEEEVTALELKITEEINTRESAITELKEDLVDLESCIIKRNNVDYDYETNRVLNSDGTLGNGLETAVVSRFIEVEYGEKYEYKGAWYLSTRSGVCCYDENKTFIKILIGSSEVPSHKLSDYMEFVIPDNAHYIKIASNNITDYPLGLKKIDNVIEKNSKSILLVNESINTTNESINTTNENLKVLDFKTSLNKNLLPLGNVLDNTRHVCITKKASGFTCGKIESPVVFWDSKLLKYGMTFTGYGKDSDGNLDKGNIGIAWSDDLLTWEMENEPLFTESGVSGSADFGSVTGGYIFIENGTYYLYYIGCSEAGYEQGTKTICMAHGTDIHNLTRHSNNPLISPTGGYTWTSNEIYKPSVYHIGNKYYMFFNAQGWCNNDTQLFGESIGYATSDDLIHWNVSSNAVLKPTGGDQSASDGYIVGDVSIYDIGDDNVYMSYYAYGKGLTDDDAKDFLAYTSKNSFPENWVKYGKAITPRRFDCKPCIIYRSGVQYHFCGANGSELVYYTSN